MSEQVDFSVVSADPEVIHDRPARVDAPFVPAIDDLGDLNSPAL
jgi:hypothetical protein